MVRKILKMFKESVLLKVHLGIILVGVALHVFLKTNALFTVVAPILFLCCTIVGRLYIDKKYNEMKMDWVFGAVDEEERYIRLEENCVKRNPEYVHLHEMLKAKMAEMGIDYKKHLHPTWIDTFKIWMNFLVEQYKTFEVTDILVAAAIMNTLISTADSDEHIMIIFESIKDLIKAPKKYECRFDETEKISLIDTGITMPTSDPDEYVKLMGKEKFIKCIKEAVHTYESADDGKTICGVFYDAYYMTKSI